VRANDSLSVSFTVANIGVDAITSVEIEANGISWLTDSSTISPGFFSSFNIMLPIGDNVSDYSYSITAQFANGDKETFSDVLVFARPDVSIGRITTITAERGVREFSINLFNDSDTQLKGSGNEVHLSFFHDSANEIPANVDGQKFIKSSEDLELLDEGGLNLQCKYVISPDDLVGREIPNMGMHLFVSAEIRNNGNLVMEHNYLANHATIGINSLLRHSEPGVAVVADVLGSNSGTIADLHIMNRSMQLHEADIGIILASLVDDNNEIIETMAIEIAGDLPGEDFITQSIQFERKGSFVFAIYESDLPGGDVTTPPGVGDIPPGSGTTPPGISGIPPGSGTTPPGIGGTPPDGTVPIQAANEPGGIMGETITDLDETTDYGIVSESPIISKAESMDADVAGTLNSTMRILLVLVASTLLLAGTVLFTIKKWRKRTQAKKQVNNKTSA